MTEKKKVDLAWWVPLAAKDKVSNYIAITAGVGAGKSHGAIQTLLYKIKKNPQGKLWFYTMPIYELILNAVFPTAEKVFESFGMIDGVHYKLVKSPTPKIELCSGQIIHCLSMHRPDKIKALEYAGGVVDEPGVTPDESIERLIERNRQKGSTPQIIMPGTPEGLENYFANNFDSERQDGWDKTKNKDHKIDRIVKDHKGEHKVRFRRFRLSTYDNEENLSETYIPNLLRNYEGNERFIQSYIYGYFQPLYSGSCYTNYRSRLHDIENIEASKHIEVNLTWDFNVNPVSWVAIQKRKFEEYNAEIQRYVAIHEAEFNNDSLEAACLEFAFKFPVEEFQYTPIIIWGDRSGHSGTHRSPLTDYQQIEAYLKELGYKQIVIRALEYNPLQPVSVEALNNWLRNFELVICKRCNNLRKSFLLTRWKEGKKQIDKPANDTWTHFTDAVKYFAYAMQEVDYKVFKSFNL